jgi:hypothetical protein
MVQMIRRRKIKKDMPYYDVIKWAKRGGEFNFYYHNDEYWISQNKDGFYLTKIGGETQSFDTIEELIKCGKIDGKSMHDVWENIKEYMA